jgi:methyl-accepting chemotaxis protein
MGEQATAATQITSAAHSMRQQGDQLAKAIDEQARAARDMTVATTNISKEIGLITRSNRQHLTSAKQVLGTLTDIRQITERNAQGVKATLSGTTNLIERAQQLAEIVNDSTTEQSGENGARQSSARPRANGNPRRPKKNQAPVVDAETGGPERPDESG